MRVLVLSNIEWSDNNAFGNTMSNLLGGLSNVEIASLYRRNSKPNNSVCKKYYKISYTSIIKNFFKKEKIGEYFETQKPLEIKAEASNEKKAIGLVHKLRLNKLIYFINDILFITKKWENERFKQFITAYNPNILFLFASANKIQNLFIKTILKYAPNCKPVIFVVDDIYAANKNYKKNISEQLKLASKVYAITPSLKKEYEDIFGVNIDILTKGCDFSFQ